MFKQFFFEMLSGRDTVSSKRSAMWWFIFLFTGSFIVNLVTSGTIITIVDGVKKAVFVPGKSPSESFQLQLFEVLITLILLVFGEKALKAWQVIKGNKNIDTSIPPDPEKAPGDAK